MNRYEAILLDKMVATNDRLRRDKTYMEEEEYDDFIHDILLLLDCICEFRELPRELDVADGYGAMAVVNIDGEVIE